MSYKLSWLRVCCGRGMALAHFHEHEQSSCSMAVQAWFEERLSRLQLLDDERCPNVWMSRK
ncbi:MAG: hypothetical protein AB8E87_03720 [Prochlorococcus sp.]|nr:hypothetical protein [Prochlorococcaceae cyanobacterium Fu_MAG_50]